jgi:Icc-related predicted phosphoesterase
MVLILIGLLLFNIIGWYSIISVISMMLIFSFFHNGTYYTTRNKLDNMWSKIPEESDILVIHGPPYSVQDLSWNKDGFLEYCGCKSLLNHCNRIKPKIVQTGHIHDGDNINNYGVKINENSYFINSTLVKDGRFDRGLIHYGILSEINENKEVKILKII